MNRHEFAEAAVLFWSKRLLTRRHPDNYPWMTTYSQVWLDAHDERLYRRCRGEGGIYWMTGQDVRGTDGRYCRRCNGIYIRSIGSREQTWVLACHEVLHAAHPAWDEGRIEAEAQKLCSETSRKALLDP